MWNPHPETAGPRRPERVGIPLEWCQRDGLKRVVRAVRGYRCAVVEIRRAVACAECGLYWDGGSEPPRCRNDNHEHRVFEVHRHLEPVVLPGGTRLTAASFDQAAPYVRARVPDYGLYLDPRWQPPWDHGHICWPDFGLPTDVDALTRTLRTVLERARSGQDVEMGCLGGHGRTGTALSCRPLCPGTRPARLSHGYGPATALKRSRHPSRKPSSLPFSAPETVTDPRSSRRLAADHTRRPAGADYHYLASAIADVMGATREMRLAKRPGGAASAGHPRLSAPPSPGRSGRTHGMYWLIGRKLLRS